MSASTPHYRFLFYAEHNYCFDILRPLQAVAIDAGHEVRWVLAGTSITHEFIDESESPVDVAEAVSWHPHAVFVPGDRVPGFIPGLKIAVFHGLNEEKRGGEYPDRGMFDLYCTEGPGRSIPMQKLASKKGYFSIKETGWLKLDTLLNYSKNKAKRDYQRPQILLASTFTPDLSCADAVFEHVEKLSKNSRWQWLITLHPKMAPETIARYRSLEGDNLQFFGNNRVIELLHRADVMVCDNSSILQEFLLLGKPVVTVNNRDPQPHMINITDVNALENAIEKALQFDQKRSDAIALYGKTVTPWLDGQSARRVMDAATALIESNWKERKPRNLWRNLRMRKMLGYWR